MAVKSNYMCFLVVVCLYHVDGGGGNVFYGEIFFSPLEAGGRSDMTTGGSAVPLKSCTLSTFRAILCGVGRWTME